MSKVCEYQGYYIDYDEETGEEDVLKCQLFTDEGEWNEYCYCNEEERNNCMLYKYSKYIENKDKEIEKLNNIINELEKCIKDKYYEAIDYQTKIRQSDLMQGNYPVRYYLEEQNEQLCNYFLNRLKDLQELKGSDKE